jgi:hypothetical protein
MDIAHKPMLRAVENTRSISKKKLNCVDVDICSVTLAKAQEIRRTQNMEIDKWNKEMQLQVKDKDFAE